jgi:FtsZ-binding cell division protein ZapB|tara:strand:+ start:424 stop:744 length:321 start_codon:yes stop_codon:yes gene_type:complete
MKDEKGQNDLEFIIEQHKRDIWEYKMKESEWVRTENQLQGTKRIVEELSAKVISLTKEIDRLSEENGNLRTIDSSHQTLNGELQRDNKYLAQQVEDYREILKKAGL